VEKRKSTTANIKAFLWAEVENLQYCIYRKQVIDKCVYSSVDGCL